MERIGHGNVRSGNACIGRDLRQHGLKLEAHQIERARGQVVHALELRLPAGVDDGALEEQDAADRADTDRPPRLVLHAVADHHRVVGVVLERPGAEHRGGIAAGRAGGLQRHQRRERHRRRGARRGQLAGLGDIGRGVDQLRRRWSGEVVEEDGACIRTARRARGRDGARLHQLGSRREDGAGGGEAVQGGEAGRRSRRIAARIAADALRVELCRGQRAGRERRQLAAGALVPQQIDRQRHESARRIELHLRHRERHGEEGRDRQLLVRKARVRRGERRLVELDHSVQLPGRGQRSLLRAGLRHEEPDVLRRGEILPLRDQVEDLRGNHRVLFHGLDAVRATADQHRILPGRPGLVAGVVQRQLAVVADELVVGGLDRIDRHLARAGGGVRIDEERARLERRRVDGGRHPRHRSVGIDLVAGEVERHRDFLIVGEPALRLEGGEQLLLRVGNGQRARVLQQQIIGQRQLALRGIEERRHHGRGRLLLLDVGLASERGKRERAQWQYAAEQHCSPPRAAVGSETTGRSATTAG